MTTFRIAVWIALALGGFSVGTGIVQPKQGCFIDPNGGPCAKDIVWADGLHKPPASAATAGAGSSIDPNGR